NQVEVETYTKQEIKIGAQTSESGYVLINDAYDPDWEVQVNGASAPLLRADYILRAIPLPAGFSTISMRYVPHYRVAGMNLRAEGVNDFSDGTMIAAWIVAGVVLWKRRKLEA
ncbi:MAG TPA: YfhO family protein, partial [Candidatus Methylacidiphilales bacterium]